MLVILASRHPADSLTCPARPGRHPHALPQHTCAWFFDVRSARLPPAASAAWKAGCVATNADSPAGRHVSDASGTFGTCQFKGYTKRQPL